MAIVLSSTISAHYSKDTVFLKSGKRGRIITEVTKPAELEIERERARVLEHIKRLETRQKRTATAIKKAYRKLKRLEKKEKSKKK